MLGNAAILPLILLFSSYILAMSLLRNMFLYVSKTFFLRYKISLKSNGFDKKWPHIDSILAK